MNLLPTLKYRDDLASSGNHKQRDILPGCLALIRLRRLDAIGFLAHDQAAIRSIAA